MGNAKYNCTPVKFLEENLRAFLYSMPPVTSIKSINFPLKIELLGIYDRRVLELINYDLAQKLAQK